MSIHRRVRGARPAVLLAISAALLALPACNDSGGTYRKLDVEHARGVAEKAANEPEPKAPEPNTEAYDHVADNPFLLAAREPLSTFSADVNTASYSNVRRFLLTENTLPPKDAVRIAELVNYFHYDYPGPHDDHPLAVSPELTVCPWNTRHRLLRVGVQSRTVDPKEMPARNFVFLVDTSGSMAPADRLPLFKKALHLLVDQLTGRDRVAIVSYAGDARLNLDTESGDHKQRIHDAIDTLHAYGSTNGGGGITLAYDIARRNFIANGVNRVILGTDGDFNVGVTNTGDLVRLIEEKRKSGVFLTVLGFGMGNLKDSTMEQLARHGRGHYAYVDSLKEAHKLFVEQGGALTTVAKDVKFQVEFNPKHVAAYRLIGYENRLLKHQEFNDDNKDAGAVGSGHTVTALYELVPPGEPLDLPGIDPLKYQTALKPSPAADASEWLTIKLRYKDPVEETSQLIAVPVKGDDFRPAPTPDCQFAAAVASFGMLLRDSPYKGDATCESVLDAARIARGDDLGGHREEFSKMVQAAVMLKK